MSAPFRFAVALAAAVAFAPLGAAAQDEPPPLTGGTPAPAAAAPAMPSPAGTTVTAIDAKIEPGDHLAIGVYGDASLTSTAVVQDDGTIQYPLVGRVAVGGQTPVQAQQTLTLALQRYVKHPIVSVAITQQGVENVLVLGNVRNTGRYALPSGAHLTQALAAAGGIAQFNGEFPKVRVLQGDGTLQVADLQKLLREGDASQNIALQNNATVYFLGAETITVQVLGAVTRPGNVQVFEGDRLSMALARAGAEAAAHPDLNHVYIRRKGPDGKSVAYQVDMYKALQGGDPKYDPVLQKNDTIYVPETRQISPGTQAVLSVIGGLLHI